MEETMQALQRSARDWERNAKSNALWAVLTDNGRKSDGWDVDEFFATGRAEVRTVMGRLIDLGVFPSPSGSFLDFGCGVGRATRALMEYFAEGYGFDISETMIAMARKYSAEDRRKARYVVNPNGNLRVLANDSIDLVYSHIVLQHVPASYQPGFIVEFMRVLKPGGMAVFQIPTATVEPATGKGLRATKRMLHRILPRAALTHVKRALGKDASTATVSMDMNICSEETIRWIIVRNRCVLLDAPFTNSTDVNHRGRIRFMSREEALAEINEGRTESPYLSQFFFVRK
jgi:ubiquinone/menaquinone biosynthesis C-methylase UbiE